MPKQDDSQRSKDRMTIAMTPEDKIWLKTRAVERNQSAAQIIHEWIDEARSQSMSEGGTHER